MNKNRYSLALLVKIGLCVVNGALAIAFYVANANYSTSGIAKTGFGTLAEYGYLAGLIIFMLLVIVRSVINKSIHHQIILIIVTAWNQTCLIAFLASTVPFHLN